MKSQCPKAQMVLRAGGLWAFPARWRLRETPPSRPDASSAGTSISLSQPRSVGIAFLLFISYPVYDVFVIGAATKTPRCVILELILSLQVLLWYHNVPLIGQGSSHHVRIRNHYFLNWFCTYSKAERVLHWTCSFVRRLPQPGLDRAKARSSEL